MGFPEGPVAVPPVVSRLAAGADVEPVWTNEAGGLTFRLPDPGGGAGRFCKWAPAGAPLDLAAEAERLGWARAWTSVPVVLEVGEDARGSWLLTQALPGATAVAPRWRARPEVAVPALARGLRALHDVLPVPACPYEWSAARRLRVAVGDTTALRDPPPVERLVVCHGDACSPNTLLGEDGRVTGHVDLGALGLADRWADLAVATMSLGWNYGPGWEATFLDAYGVEPDPVRTRYYRDLWRVGP